MRNRALMAKRWEISLALVAVLFIGAGARLVSWPQVFTPEGIRFVGDDDTYYHVLRAKWIVDQFPKIPWEDPLINYPAGAAILWPPLLDVIIAWTAKTVGLGHPSPDLVEGVAAFVPVFLGVLTLILLAVIGTQLVGKTAGVAAALVVALLPAHVTFSVLGRPDHHVTEALFCTWVFAAFIAGMRSGSGMRNWIIYILLGLGIAFSFWNWNGSGLYLMFLVLSSGLWYVGACPGNPASYRMSAALFGGGLSGAVLLGLSLFMFGRPGTLHAMTLNGVSGFQVVLAGLTACFGGLLLLAQRRPLSSLSWRLVLVGMAAAIPLSLALVVLPGFSSSVVHGLTALGRANAWYKNIKEFDPLIFAGFDPIGSELFEAAKLYSLLPLIIPFAIGPIVSRWKARADERPSFFFLVLWAGAFLVLALARKRFAIYFVLPLSFLIILAFHQIGWWLSNSVRSPKLRLVSVFAGGMILFAPALFWFAGYNAGADPTRAELIRTVKWLGGQRTGTHGHEGVLAEWSYGHLIEYFSNKPTVVNPFGTDLGPGAMEDSAAFFQARDGRRADAILQKRRIGFLLLANPLTEAYFSLSFAPPGTSPAVAVTRAWMRELRVEVQPDFWKLVASRLYFFDGMAGKNMIEPPLVNFRLLYESPVNETWMRLTTASFKVFGVVPGAVLAVHTLPSRAVAASARIISNQGRVFDYRITARTNASGIATMRLPYATGTNGAVNALSYMVTDGMTERSLSVSEAYVTGDLTVEIDLR